MVFKPSCEDSFGRLSKHNMYMLFIEMDLNKARELSIIITISKNYFDITMTKQSKTLLENMPLYCYSLCMKEVIASEGTYIRLRKTLLHACICMSYIA